MSALVNVICGSIDDTQSIRGELNECSSSSRVRSIRALCCNGKGIKIIAAIVRSLIRRTCVSRCGGTADYRTCYSFIAISAATLMTSYYLMPSFFVQQ